METRSVENNNTMNHAEQKKILIVGGAGYVGGYLTDLLTHRGYDVTVYDNLTYETRYLKPVRFIYGDIRDTDMLSSIINDYDVVIWLAAIVGDGACAVSPMFTTQINVKTIEWLAKHYQGKVVFMSTCSVYGENNAILNESSETNPLSLYAQTKLKAEEIISEHTDDYLIFRLGTLFGLGDLHSRVRLDIVVNTLTKKACLGEPLTVYGGGQWRPLLHVKDVAEAIQFGIENNIRGLFNLSNSNYRISEIAHAIEKIISNTEVIYANMKFEDLRNYRVNAEKFTSLGWQPKFDLIYGITEMYRTIKGQRIKEPNDLLYTNASFIKSKVV